MSGVDGWLPDGDPDRTGVDDARIVEAAAQRRSRRELADQAGEDGSLAGVLRDLAEKASVISVHTSTGSHLNVSIKAVGADFVLLTTGHAEVVVTHRALRRVEVDASDGVTGVGSQPLDVSLGEVLVSIARERRRVEIHSPDVPPVTGSLEMAGVDLVRIWTPGGRRVYVPLGAVAEIVLD